MCPHRQSAWQRDHLSRYLGAEAGIGESLSGLLHCVFLRWEEVGVAVERELPLLPQPRRDRRQALHMGPKVRRETSLVGDEKLWARDVAVKTARSRHPV